MKYDIKDGKLAKDGKLKIEWAMGYMPVLKLIRERFRNEKPLKGTRIGCCLHVTTETANLMLTLQAGGAEVALCASNPLSTQDDVAASLVKDYNISTFAIKGEGNKTYYKHLKCVLDIEPSITMDDGADLVSAIHMKMKNLAGKVLGGSEETTTGVIRLRSLEKSGGLLFPMIAVNDADTKHLFDNRYGTGQSTIDGLIRATNILLSGRKVIVCGYGWCGKGVAMRAKGMGAIVCVCETDPLRGLEASMDGFEVLPLKKAAKIGDVFITLTGNAGVLREEHFKLMRDGAIIANSGHFNVEIDIPALEKLSKKKRRIRTFIDEFTLKNGRRINLLGEGRLINLAAAEGHPPSVMDMSFANQALCAEFIKNSASKLERKVYNVPVRIDTEIARLKLKSMGIRIDTLTEEQKKYLESWKLGT
ncbi:MAG: adenosylhomocysteinase [Candidatus Omnitrophota bacterium]|nr:adenosylhomocysteinase [Candidatus Omnitrophota bacterium]